jgi:hypothetical protein
MVPAQVVPDVLYDPKGEALRKSQVFFAQDGLKK